MIKQTLVLAAADSGHNIMHRSSSSSQAPSRHLFLVFVPHSQLLTYLWVISFELLLLPYTYYIVSILPVPDQPACHVHPLRGPNLILPLAAGRMGVLSTVWYITWLVGWTDRGFIARQRFDPLILARPSVRHYMRCHFPGCARTAQLHIKNGSVGRSRTCGQKTPTTDDDDSIIFATRNGVN